MRSITRKPRRLVGYDYADPKRACFITSHTKIAHVTNRSPLHPQQPFTYAPLAQDLISSLDYLQTQRGVCLIAYSIMPNHIHIFARPSAPSGDIIQAFFAFKKHTARCAWRYGVLGSLWLRDCYDHVERLSNGDYQRIVAYILNNPVRAGIVASWRDHPYTRYFGEDG
jgi:REP element-mobilizing transposase RayT